MKTYKNNSICTLAVCLVLTLNLLTGAAQAETIRQFGHRRGSAGMWLERDRPFFDGAAPVNRRADIGASHTTTVTTAEVSARSCYTVVDLGGFTGEAVTESGAISGYSRTPEGYLRATFWPNSRAPGIDLGTLPGFPGSFASMSNPSGQIVGFSGDGSIDRPVFWANPYTGPMELAGVPSDLSGQAYDINPRGQIVGQVYNDDFSIQRPVLWNSSNSALVYLPQMSSEFPRSLASSINNAGNILGDECALDNVHCHAAFWASSTSSPVALAPPGGEFIYTDIVFEHAINNAGNMIGYAFNADYTVQRGVYWASSTSPAVLLSTSPNEFPIFLSGAINDHREIVGQIYNADFTDSHALLWRSPTAQGINLNTLIPVDSGWILLGAHGINNRGEIVGRGRLNGIRHAFLLIPVHGSSN